MKKKYSLHPIRKSIILALLFFFTVSSESVAANTSSCDTIRISLLTCSPGKRIYELYGHTGIRVNIPSRKFDVVYHYGVFSFNTPHFTYRFVKGETDYSIGAMPYYDFVSMYAARGSSVSELPLNLTLEEARNLFVALNINTMPANAVYRYSFLYDNCATRPRDMIARSVNGYIVYSQQSHFPTFREIIHDFTRAYPWMTFGIDLLLGEEVDCRIDFVATPFLPAVTETLLAGAVVEESGGGIRPLAVSEPKITVAAETGYTNASVRESVFTPGVVNTAILLIVILLSVVELRKGKHFKILDTIIYVVYGTVGILIYFLLLFSEHPAVSSNYNALWLHPLWYLIAVLLWIKRASGFLYYYHFINFALVFAVLAGFSIIPQRINAACIPLMVILLVRSFTYIAVEKGVFRAAPRDKNR